MEALSYRDAGARDQVLRPDGGRMSQTTDTAGDHLAATAVGDATQRNERCRMNVIEANDLGKRYGNACALRACTLAVPAGHLTALVGPNGAGKTTLLNLAVGL